jgi:hypothetical protein
VRRSRPQTDSLGDITTLADPGVVADLIERAAAAIAEASKKPTAA